MSRVKWVKLWVGINDDEKMKLIDGMENRDVIFYIWIRLIIQAGKNNSKGDIFLAENMPYTKEMLSVIFNRPIEQIEAALKILVDLRMIEVNDSNFIKILNWEKHQNIEGLEKIREQTRKRVEKYREKNKCNADVTEQKKSEIENKNEIKIEVEKKSKIENEKEIKIEIEGKDEIENKKEIKMEIEEKGEINNKDENVIEIKKNSERCNATDGQIDTGKKEVIKIECFSKNRTEREAEMKDDYVFENHRKRGLESADEIISYTKTIEVKFIGVTLAAVKLAVSDHGVRNVKLAIDKAVEANKPRMTYINGILENWSREGYPEEKSCSNGNFIGGAKRRKLFYFNNFEPRDYDYKELEKRLLGWE